MAGNFLLWLQLVPFWLTISGIAIAGIGIATLLILSIRRQIVAQCRRRDAAKRSRLRRLNEASGA
jgi:hypothetical protein